jgi:hypothetical protein
VGEGRQRARTGADGRERWALVSGSGDGAPVLSLAGDYSCMDRTTGRGDGAGGRGRR